MAEIQVKGKTKRTRSNKFTSVPLELLTCKHMVNKETGEIYEMTDTSLRVYLYMRNRYCWVLDNPNQNTYFESWESIANAIGKTKDLFKGNSKNRPDKLLTSIGLLKTEKIKGSRSVNKIVLDTEDIKDRIDFISNIEYKEYVPKTIEDKVIPEKTVFVEDPNPFDWEEFEDDSLPF